MITVSKKNFLQQFADRGLDLDQRYQRPQTLVFPEKYDLSWSWEIPKSPTDLTRFVTSLFDACKERDSFYLYPRKGAWGCGTSLKLFQMAAVFSRVGRQPAPDDVLLFSFNEIDAVVTLFSIALVFGCTVSDDIFAIPSHGKIILYADHHEEVHANFENEDVMNKFIPQIAVL